MLNTLEEKFRDNTILFMSDTIVTFGEVMRGYKKKQILNKQSRCCIYKN